MLTEHGFVVIYAHVSKLPLEAVASVHALHPSNTKCLQCKGSGRVPMRHGLRDKVWRPRLVKATGSQVGALRK